jgi:uncharacterized protein with PIN domain
MIIETSASLAMPCDEPDGPALLRRIAEASIRLLSSASVVVAFTGSKYREYIER